MLDLLELKRLRRPNPVDALPDQIAILVASKKLREQVLEVGLVSGLKRCKLPGEELFEDIKVSIVRESGHDGLDLDHLTRFQPGRLLIRPREQEGQIP